MNYVSDRETSKEGNADPYGPFRSILAELEQLHCKKSHDYGSRNDPYANVRASEKFGIPAWLGCLIREHDKTIRVQSFVEKGKLVNEPLEDALMDKCVYSIMALMLYREQKEKDKYDKEPVTKAS